MSSPEKGRDTPFSLDSMSAAVHSQNSPLAEAASSAASRSGGSDASFNQRSPHEDYKHHPYVTAPASWGEVPSGGTTRSEALDIRSAAGHVTPLATPFPYGTQSTPVPSVASISSRGSTKELSIATPASIAGRAPPAQHARLSANDTFVAAQQSLQRPMISAKARLETEKLFIHIPFTFAYDRKGVEAYVTTIRRQHALFMTHIEKIEEALRRMRTSCGVPGTEMPRDVQEQQAVLMIQQQQCKINLKSIRIHASGSTEFPNQANLIQASSGRARSHRQVVPRSLRDDVQGMSGVSLNSIPRSHRFQTPVQGPDDLQFSTLRSEDVQISRGRQLFSKPPPEWAGSKAPFERTEQGELRRSMFTAGELHAFLVCHVRDRVPLKLWIQRAPEISSVAPQDLASLRCRFNNCAHGDQLRAIAPYDIRVALDESPCSNGAVGYVHLICLEQNFHLPTLIRKFRNVAAEVYRPQLDLKAAETAGIFCSPAVSIISKFVLASEEGALNQMCTDYPEAGSGEEFPAGFTGQDELTLAYKLQWAHQIAASEVYKLLNQTGTRAKRLKTQKKRGSKQWERAREHERGEELSLKEQTISSPPRVDDIKMTETNGLDGVNRPAQREFSSPRKKHTPGDRRDKPSLPVSASKLDSHKLTIEGGTQAKLDPREFRRMDQSKSTSNHSASPDDEQPDSHMILDASDSGLASSPAAQYPGYDVDADFDKDTDFPERHLDHQATIHSTMQSLAGSSDPSDLIRVLDTPASDKVSGMREKVKALRRAKLDDSMP